MIRMSKEILQVTYLDSNRIMVKGIEYMSGVSRVDSSRVMVDGMEYINGIRKLDKNRVLIDGVEYRSDAKTEKKTLTYNYTDHSCLEKGRLLVIDAEWYVSGDLKDRIYELAWSQIENGFIVDHQCLKIDANESSSSDDAIKRFRMVVEACDVIISHNLPTDKRWLEKDGYLNASIVENKSMFCSMYGMRDRFNNGKGKFKSPKLDELFVYLFGCEIPNVTKRHTAGYDCELLTHCILKIRNQDYVCPLLIKPHVGN